MKKNNINDIITVEISKEALNIHGILEKMKLASKISRRVCLGLLIILCFNRFFMAEDSTFDIVLLGLMAFTILLWAVFSIILMIRYKKMCKNYNKSK